ncbi:hypothetical protein ACH4E8_03840 [Streptomyces sp. NPDC017979]|uniref:hypothetical protein n=1 Tax=Streptomyces sp. NPDC017979 TaxID=3365024 RepID=UPI00379E9463
MADLGGYLAVSYVAEHVVTDALEAIWRTQWENACGTANWSADTPVGRLDATGGISVDKPAVAFHGAENRVAVHLTGTGRFDLTLNGAAAGGVIISVDATALVPVRVTQESITEKAVVDLGGFGLDTTQLRTAFFDGPHVPNADTALLDPAARAALTEQIRRFAQQYLVFRLPTDRIWLAELMLTTQGIPGSILVTPAIKLGDARILDGWLALGIDATSSVGESHGNAAQIGPPPDAPPPAPAPMPQEDAGDASLRLLVDPALAVTYLQANARFALIMATATQPNLHPSPDVGIRFEDDSIVLNASGTVDAPDPFPGQMPFTADVRIRPFIPLNSCTIYASVKPDITVDAPWFLIVLGMIADFFGIHVFAKLQRANRSQMATLFGVKITMAVPELFGVYARVEGRRVVARPDLFGIYGEAAITTTSSEAPTDVTPFVGNSVAIRSRFLRLSVDTFRSDRLATDPTFRIRYRLTRGSNGTEVTAGTTWSGSKEPFGDEVDLWDDSNVLETSFRVELATERPPGTVLAQNVHSITVQDKFDRSHPFVRWRKQHYFTPSPVPAGMFNPTPITSAIHRTAIRERCKFCDTIEGRFGTPYEFQALDSLPAPDDPAFSNRLCQYCFPDG